jgi:hypothetical protein
MRKGEILVKGFDCLSESSASSVMKRGHLSIAIVFYSSIKGVSKAAEKQRFF